MNAGQRRTVRWFGITVAAIAVPATVLYFRNDNVVDPFLARQSRLVEWGTADDPVLSDLARGRVRAGDSVEDFLAAHPKPDTLVRHGDYVTVIYGAPVGTKGPIDSIMLVAKHGKLVSAVKYGLHPREQFFHDESAIAPDYWATYRADVNRRAELRWQLTLAIRGGLASYYPGPDEGAVGPGIGTPATEN